MLASQRQFIGVGEKVEPSQPFLLQRPDGEQAGAVGDLRPDGAQKLAHRVADRGDLSLDLLRVLAGLRKSVPGNPMISRAKSSLPLTRIKLSRTCIPDPGSTAETVIAVNEDERLHGLPFGRPYQGSLSGIRLPAWRGRLTWSYSSIMRERSLTTSKGWRSCLASAIR